MLKDSIVLSVVAALAVTGARAGDAYDYKKLTTTTIAPVQVTTNKAGTVVYDFGKEYFGFVTLTPGVAATGDYEVRLGELLRGDRVNLKPGGTIRATTVTGSLANETSHRVPLNPNKRNTRRNRKGGAILIPKEFGVVMPLRYVEVVSAPFATTKGAVSLTALHYPMDLSASSFSCSDERLVKVWDLCKHSIFATSFAGLYVDGDRERIPYEADAYINQLGEYAVHADYSLARASHEYLMDHPTWPTEWLQHSIKMAWTDWMWTGDTRSLAKYYDALKTKKLLRNFARPSDGLLLSGGERGKGARPGLSDIVDWPDGERDGYVFKPVNTEVNAFYYKNLLEMADIARALGKDADAADFAAEAVRVKESFNRVFFDKARGVYVDGEGTDHASLHANAIALAFGLVPDAQKASVVQFVKSRGMACSVYFAQFLLEGLFEAGEDEAAAQLMMSEGPRSWLNMLAQGATITMEAWRPQDKKNLDLNHAWGAPPINIISRYMLGVRPLKPGFDEVLIAPRLGGLTRLEGRVPTAKGPIDIVATTDALTVTLPEGVKEKIVFNGKVTVTRR